jgi:AhpD family alkylhydroperoxidase
MKQQFNKRIFTIKEFFHILDLGIGSSSKYKKAKKENLIKDDFKERIMLAVTEVNGCEVCSYYHTKEALNSGLSEDEISAMLTGNTENLNKDEAIAIFFAQHYAETGGYPDKDSWKRVVQAYGKVKAEGVLAVIRMIMVGNAYGIAYGAFKNRLKGDAVKKSSLGKELGIMIGGILFIPIVLIKNSIPLIRANIEI